MAEARLVSKRISRDKRVAQLTPPSGLLYAFSIPHLDIEGRMDGSALAVRGTVVRAYAELQPAQWTDELVRQYMHEWETTTPRPLVGIYTADDTTVAFFPGFAKNQRLRKDREAPSRLPAPPPEVLVRLGLACEVPGDSGAAPGQKTEDEVEVEVELAGLPTAEARYQADGLPVAQQIADSLSDSGLRDQEPARLGSDLGRLAVSPADLEAPSPVALPSDDLRAIAARISDADDGTVHVLTSLRRRGLPPAAFHAALESLDLRRGRTDRKPLQSEVRYVVSALKTMLREGQYAKAS